MSFVLKKRQETTTIVSPVDFGLRRPRGVYFITIIFLICVMTFDVIASFRRWFSSLASYMTSNAVAFSVPMVEIRRHCECVQRKTIVLDTYWTGFSEPRRATRASITDVGIFGLARLLPHHHNGSSMVPTPYRTWTTPYRCWPSLLSSAIQGVVS